MWDLLVMDMEKNDMYPLMLGKTFIHNARVTLDTDNNTLTIKNRNKETCLNLFKK